MIHVFQDHPLLGIHGKDLTARHAEERGIEESWVFCKEVTPFDCKLLIAVVNGQLLFW